MARDRKPIVTGLIIAVSALACAVMAFAAYVNFALVSISCSGNCTLPDPRPDHAGDSYWSGYRFPGVIHATVVKDGKRYDYDLPVTAGENYFTLDPPKPPEKHTET